MADLEQSLHLVLKYLAEVPRDDSGYGWTMGQPIANATGLSPTDINDAAALLVESGHAKWMQALDSLPWHFTLLAIAPRGRAMYEKAKSGLKMTSPEAPVTVNITAENFSGVAAANVSGQTTVVSHQNSVKFDARKIRDVFDEVRKYKDSLGLTPRDAESLEREIRVVDAELAAESPDESRVKQAIRSIKGIVEAGVGGGITSVVATGVIHLLTKLIGG
jgi:hypothetical protein